MESVEHFPFSSILHSGTAALLVLVLIHLYANQATILGWVWHGRFLSFASGISFAYVFVNLLPELGEGQPILKATFDPIVPFLDKHAYVIALLGLLFSYGLQQPAKKDSIEKFWVRMSGYQLFNFFVGASLVDVNDPEIQPLILFTLAMGMHYFVHDHNMLKDDPILYAKYGRYWLVLALIAGYVMGLLMHIPDAVVAIFVAFLAGGVMLNVLRYELPKQESEGDYWYFIFGALLYTILLLAIGQA